MTLIGTELHKKHNYRQVQLKAMSVTQWKHQYGHSVTASCAAWTGAIYTDELMTGIQNRSEKVSGRFRQIIRHKQAS